MEDENYSLSDKYSEKNFMYLLFSLYDHIGFLSNALRMFRKLISAIKCLSLK